jgi:hypothetical protein
MVLRREITKGGSVEPLNELEMREAQLVLMSLEERWSDERNRCFELLNDLNVAERRLLALFSEEWEARGGEKRLINLAYSHYRRQLMRQFGLRRFAMPVPVRR